MSDVIIIGIITILISVPVTIWRKLSSEKLLRHFNGSQYIPVEDNESRTASLGSLSSGIQTDYASETSISVENTEDVTNTCDEQGKVSGTLNRLRQLTHNSTYAFRRHIVRPVSSTLTHRYASIKSIGRRNNSPSLEDDIEAQRLLESDDEDTEGISNPVVEYNPLGITDQTVYSTERKTDKESDDQVPCGFTPITVYNDSMQSSSERNSSETNHSKNLLTLVEQR